MAIKAILILATLISSASLGAEGLGAYFPEKSAAKATRLLALIDQISVSIDSKRGQARADQVRAQAGAVEAYALIASSRGRSETWARPDGSVLATDAPQAYASARLRAKEASRLLSGGGDANAEAASLPILLASREASAASLAQLILASGLGQKASIGLEKLLAGKSRSLAKVFPEAADATAVLMKAGTAGAREAAAAMAHRGPEDIARALLVSKARLAALSPSVEIPLTKLEASFAAYLSWVGASPIAAYPGDLATASAEDREAISAGILAIAGMPAGRAAALFAGMSEGDGRDVAAVESASELARLWEGLPEVRRFELSSHCGLPYYSLASFSSTLSAADDSKRTAGVEAGVKPSKLSDWLSIMAALNALEVSIADEESRGVAAQAAEPVLILLERPELAAVSRSETRYASLSAEAAHRIGSLYAQAAENASIRLEASASLVQAAALALGSASSALNSASSALNSASNTLGSPSAGPSARENIRLSVRISVRAIDLQLPQGNEGRRIAFVAVATSSAGASVSLPLPAGPAAVEYAAAFARTARLSTDALGSSRADPVGFLAKYGQCVVAAYDPEGSNDSLAIEALPREGGPAPLSGAELELALLVGWRP